MQGGKAVPCVKNTSQGIAGIGHSLGSAGTNDNWVVTSTSQSRVRDQLKSLPFLRKKEEEKRASWKKRAATEDDGSEPFGCNRVKAKRGRHISVPNKFQASLGQHLPFPQSREEPVSHGRKTPLMRKGMQKRRGGCACSKCSAVRTEKIQPWAGGILCLFFFPFFFSQVSKEGPCPGSSLSRRAYSVCNTLRRGDGWVASGRSLRLVGG